MPMRGGSAPAKSSARLLRMVRECRAGGRTLDASGLWPGAAQKMSFADWLPIIFGSAQRGKGRTSALLSLCRIEKGRLVVRNQDEIARLKAEAPGLAFFTIDQAARAKGVEAPIFFDPDAVGMLLARAEDELRGKEREARLAYAEGLLFCLRSLSVGHVMESKREIREALNHWLRRHEGLEEAFRAHCRKLGWTIELR